MDLAERAGHWTLARLSELPRDGNRYEVIDGNLIVTPPPPLCKSGPPTRDVHPNLVSSSG